MAAPASDTIGRARLSFANESEIDEFVAMLARFEAGEIGADAWRVFRLIRGTYGQRQDDVHMLRVKIPQGVLTPPQLDALADIAERHSRGFGHITTRQNMQFHFMQLHEVEMAMRRLAEAGLTTREACGSSVRNITACPYAGVAEDEIFDVTPYAEALTRHLLRHPLSSSLPRKFKIAFEGCRNVDHALTPINDLGFRAWLGPGGGRGFRVTAGGGTATLCSAGALLYDFLPASELLEFAEAVIRVFHQFGDFQHKHRNRMKFLIRQLGWDRWRDEVEIKRRAIRDAGRPPLPFDPESPGEEGEPDWPQAAASTPCEIEDRVRQGTLKGPGILPGTHRLPLIDDNFGAWLTTNVRFQKQRAYRLVTATLPLGDLTAAQMRTVGELAAAYGDGTVRTTQDQNLLFRWVRIASVVPLYHGLLAAGLARSGVGRIVDVTSCPGAESCRLAVTQSRGLGRVLSDVLRAQPDLVEAAGPAAIKISGCPNGCGQHHVAAIGLQGSVRKIGNRAVPHYVVMTGGQASGDSADFAERAARIPARRVPEAIERLVHLYSLERLAGETLTEYFNRADPAVISSTLADLEHVDPDTLTADDVIDFGETAAFQPEVLDGECSV
jgi:sulfite reductase beta subunit-like hemoprotein